MILGRGLVAEVLYVVKLKGWGVLEGEVKRTTASR